MKNKLNYRILLIMAFALAAFLALPLAAFAASNITREYRYADGQPQPAIPGGFVTGGVEYRLAATSAPTREGDMATTRTYNYRLSGAVSPADLAAYQSLPGVIIKEVDATYERATNDAVCRVTVSGLPTNDLNDLKAKGYYQNVFTVADANSATGEAAVTLPIAEVSFAPVLDSDGIPASYAATMIYRGTESFSGVHYYEVTQTITSKNTTTGGGEWVIVATFAPVALTNTGTTVTPGAGDNGAGGAVTPPVDQAGQNNGTTIGNTPTPLASGIQGLSPDDTAKIGAQTGNFFKDLFSGNIPLGNFSVTGSWSALSALLGITGIVTAVLSLVSTFLANRVGRRLFGILAIAFGALTPIVWALLDSLNNPVTVLNSNTPVVLAIAVASVVCFFLRGNYVRDEEERYSQEEAYTTK